MEKYPNTKNGSPNDLNILLKVKEKRYESVDCLSIIFERPRGLLYEPGDWMDIRFLTADLSVGKTYSFASSPTEPDLLITFKKGVSKFKKALEKVQAGDKLLITQYGSNGFLLNPRFNSVFIAGGIGVTPFRSMLKAAIDNKVKTNITLFYLNHTDNFLFRYELEEWQKEFDFLKIIFIITKAEGRLTKENLQKIITGEQMYYIAGSPPMVTSYQNTLKELGISDANIKIDRFEGY